MTGLKEIFIQELQKALSIERQLLVALEKAAQAASCKKLAAVLESHAGESLGHIARLIEVFEILGQEPKSFRCKGIEGILRELDAARNADFPHEITDVALSSFVQRAERFEIATYESLCSRADALGSAEILELLQHTLDEERAADAELSELARWETNPAAAAATRRPKAIGS